MRLRSLVLAFLLAPMLLLAGCSWDLISGDGHVLSQLRDVPAFRKVDVGSAINATISTGARAVTVRTDQNIQGLLETVVSGDTLNVRLKAGTAIAHATALEVLIANDAIEHVSASGAADVTSAATPTADFGVEASGASDVTITGVSATSISIEASGGSRITVSGAATSGRIEASGASDVNSKAVSFTSADIDLSGASTLKATVTGSLTGVMSGASTAKITGTPTTAVSTSGGSELSTGMP